MKIRAIRLADVGPFAAPVALEGLTGGLDVLAGPNELGKSTILQAVRLGLTTAYSSKHRDIEALRPYQGGAPLIEVDFDAAGTRWRLRKKFLANRTAELVDLGSNLKHSGGDVQPALDALLATAAGGGANLLWVSQGEPTAPARVDSDLQGSLTAALGAEVANAADSGAAAALAKAVRDALGVLVTAKTGKPRAGGPLDAAEKSRARLMAAAAAATARAGEAAQRLERLGETQVAKAALAHPTAIAERAAAVADARAALAEGLGAREKLKAATLALTAAEQQAAHTRERADQLEKDLADAAGLDAALAADAAAADALAGKSSAAAAAEAAARSARDQARAGLAAIDGELKRAAAREAHAALAEARAAAAEQANVTAGLAGFSVTAELVAAARREREAIVGLEAQLAASAPRVTITPEPAARTRMQLAGRALAETETFRPEQPLTIEIAGVGTITVAPGTSADAADLKADLAAHREQLAASLARAGAATLDAAVDLERRRQSLTQQRAGLAERLARLAPDGLERLASAAAAAPLGAAPQATAPVESRADLLARHTSAGAALAAADQTLEHAAQASATVREAASALAARIATNRQRRDLLASSLPPEAERAGLVAQRDTERAGADAARRDAQRSRDSWRDAAPDDQRFAASHAAVAAAEARAQEADRQLATFDQTMARLEGELTADRNEDAHARALELSEALAVAEADVAALAADRDALLLLDTEIAAAQAEQNEDVVRPVLARMQPYLAHVWPDAQLTLGADFAVTKLVRGGRPEDLDRLSGGTQEQIALLARLGLGRLLAERGQAMPLILDDALVYSDDIRIDAMFRALTEAATHHQVIVLTCRQRLFAPLAGTRLALAPWAAG